MSSTTTETALPLAEQIREAIQAEKVQPPPLPELALRLRETMEDDNRASAKHIADLVRNDAAVTASLLRFANSAAFGGLRRITSLDQAIARLGLKQVDALVTSMQVKGHFNSPVREKNEILKMLWNHSVATATGAKKLALREDADSEEAFLAGLLHDCGKLLVLKGVDQIETAGTKDDFTRPVIDELMDMLHAELGHHTLTSWKLPESVCEVALKHELPLEEDSSRLLCYVQAANLTARKLGFHLDPQPELDLLEEDSFERLEIRDIELATLMVDLEDEILGVQNLL